jgi:undecaprenyl-diphosphatase
MSATHSPSEFLSAPSPARRLLIAAAAALLCGPALAAGGPFGIDHRLAEDDTGIWARRNQQIVLGGVILSAAAGALWEGDSSRLGHTLWQSVDAMAIGALTSESMKIVFSRSRPTQSDDPNQWFQGRGHRSFPSGEVMAMTTAITPLVLEFAGEHPAVWALELLPLYDAVARMKVRAHWQSDVLVSFGIGTAIGAYTHARPTSLSVGILPHGVTVGWKTTF